MHLQGWSAWFPQSCWVAVFVPETAEIYSSQFRRSEVHNQHHWAETTVLAIPWSLWRLSGKIHSLPLPIYDGNRHSLACGHITAVSASIWLLLFCMHPVALCLSPRKTLLIGLRAYWIIQDGLPKSWSFTYICKDPFFIKGCTDRFPGGPDVFEWPLFQEVIRKSQENEGGSGGLRTHRKK